MKTTKEKIKLFSKAHRINEAIKSGLKERKPKADLVKLVDELAERRMKALSEEEDT